MCNHSISIPFMEVFLIEGQFQNKQFKQIIVLRQAVPFLGEPVELQ